MCGTDVEGDAEGGELVLGGLVEGGGVRGEGYAALSVVRTLVRRKGIGGIWVGMGEGGLTLRL